MFKRLSKVLIVLALTSSIGLHWAFLQTVAWAGMIVSYSQKLPLTKAVEKTFDGQHPCSLCKHIAKAKQSERKTEYKFESSKLEFSYAPALFMLNTPAYHWSARAGDISADLLTQAPPVPPPRIF